MELYQRYGPALRRKCERMLGNREEAEDIVQQLFVDLIRMERTDVDLPYLYRAATTRTLNRIRDRRRRSELLAQHGEIALGGESPGVEARIVGTDLLVQLVDGLDERSAEILFYRYVDRMAQGEIAALLGVSRRTVGKRLARIREQLLALAATTPAETVPRGES